LDDRWVELWVACWVDAKDGWMAVQKDVMTAGQRAANLAARLGVKKVAG
jgi:hypothetical protein